MSGRSIFWAGFAVLIAAGGAGGVWRIRQITGPPISGLPPDAPAARAPQPPYRRATSLPTSEPSATEIARAKQIIEQLDDADFKVRQAASLRLNSLDGACLNIVETAYKDPAISPERKLRLEAALHYLRPRARFQRPQQLRAAWVDKTLHEGYANGEHSDPRWDGAAHRGIDLVIQLGFDPLHAPSRLRQEELDVLADAIEAGCDDPFIKSLYGMCLGRVAGGARSYGLGGGIYGDSQRVLKEEYPAFIKLFACIGYLYVDDRADPAACMAPASLLEELAKQPDLPPGELPYLADQYCRALIHVIGGARYLKSFWDRYQQYASPLDFLVVQGITKNNLGNGRRREEADMARQDFAEAARLGEEAWRLDPSDPRAPRLMMVVSRNQGADWEQIETWFRRTVEADPDALEAYTRKLDYLWEQRSGDADADAAAALLDFGRECLATQNWRAGVPMILAEAHRRLANGSKDRRQYLARPEVWRDVQEAYEGVLLNFSDDVKRRSEYAKLASQCGRWDVAHQQFLVLGDKADMGVFVSQESYNYLRRKAKRLGGDGAPAPVQ